MKQTLLKFTILSLVLLSQVTTKAQTWAWKNQIETNVSSSNEVYNDVAVDGFGNAYAVGYFDGIIVFNGSNITSKGSNDILITKTNQSGQIIWIKSFGTKGDDKANSITLDNKGIPYLTGYYTGKITFGSTVLDSVNTMSQVFVTKLDTAGNAIWATKVVSARNNSGNGIEYSKKSGLLLVAGKMGGTMSFDGGISLTGSGADNVFIGKLDTLGIWKNATKIHSSASFTIGGFALDANENIFVSFSTYITNTTPINVYKADLTTISSNLITGLNITAQNGGIIYIARIASDYSTSSKWAYQAYQTLALNNGLAIGPDNNPVFLFAYRGMNAQYSYQARKLSNDLTTNNAIWARNIGGTYFNPGGIVIDKDTTTSVLFGTTNGTLDNTGSGASTITLATGMNFYLARINSKGQWLATTNIGASGVNYTPDGIFLNGGIGIDTTTKELRVGVNLAYQNFKVGTLSLNSKAPLLAGKFDAFLLKFGCVNAGFITQPKDSLACPNGTIYANVEATGSNLTYSWKKNNVAIGTNLPYYSKTAAAFADSGYYKVDIRSVCFKDTTYAKSDSVKLGVKLAPVIITQPKGDTICIGKYAKLGVKAKGYGITYSWNYTGCSNCVLSTTDTMTRLINSLYSASQYYVTISDVCNRTNTSSLAPIVAETPITAYSIVAGATTCEEGVFKLTTTATSTGYTDPNAASYVPKLKYTWKKNNVIIPDYNFNYLDRSNVTFSDSGSYTVDISNTGCKTPVTTTAVKVYVNAASAQFNSGNNLKFYLPFNGTFADESGTNNYTTTSTATFTNDRNSTANSAANFTAANTTNQIRVKDSLFFKSTIGTLSFWFKTSALNQVLLGTQDKALNASPNQTLINAYIDNSGYFKGAMYTGGTFITTAIRNNSSKSVVNDNKWHNVVITYNTNTQSIYIDGILQYTIAGTIFTKSTNNLYNFTVSQFGSTGATGNNIYAGLYAGTSFVGQLDDISIHGVAFDACDVGRLYSLGIKLNVLGLEVNDLTNNISFYPNPFDNILSIESNEYFGAVVISDINGKKVISADKDATLLNINTAHLPSGVYIVKVGNLTKKIIK